MTHKFVNTHTPIAHISALSNLSVRVGQATHSLSKLVVEVPPCVVRTFCRTTSAACCPFLLPDCSSAKVLVVLHHMPAICFVVHIKGRVHETDCSHFLHQQNLLLFCDRAVSELFVFLWREAFFQRYGSQVGLHFRKEVVVGFRDVV